MSSPFRPIEWHLQKITLVTFRGVQRMGAGHYDISGRRVGTYRGDRIGEGLQAGVYFVRTLEGKAGMARIVKIR